MKWKANNPFQDPKSVTYDDKIFACSFSARKSSHYTFINRIDLY